MRREDIYPSQQQITLIPQKQSYDDSRVLKRPIQSKQTNNNGSQQHLRQIFVRSKYMDNNPQSYFKLNNYRNKQQCLIDLYEDKSMGVYNSTTKRNSTKIQSGRQISNHNHQHIRANTNIDTSHETSKTQLGKRALLRKGTKLSQAFQSQQEKYNDHEKFQHNYYEEAQQKASHSQTENKEVTQGTSSKYEVKKYSSLIDVETSQSAYKVSYRSKTISISKYASRPDSAARCNVINKSHQVSQNKFGKEKGYKENHQHKNKQPPKVNTPGSCFFINTAFNLMIPTAILSEHKEQEVQNKTGSDLAFKATKEQNLNVSSKNSNSELIRKLVNVQQTHQKWKINNLYFNNLGKITSSTKMRKKSQFDQRSLMEESAKIQIPKNFSRSIPTRKLHPQQKNLTTISNVPSLNRLSQNLKNLQLDDQQDIILNKDQPGEVQTIINNQDAYQCSSQVSYQNNFIFAKPRDQNHNNFKQSQEPMGLLKYQLPSSLPKIIQEAIVVKRVHYSQNRNPNHHKKTDIRRKVIRGPSAGIVKSINKVRINSFETENANQNSEDIIRQECKAIDEPNHQVKGSRDQSEETLDEFNIQRRSIRSSKSGKEIFQLEFSALRHKLPQDTDQITPPKNIRILPYSQCKLQGHKFQMQSSAPNAQMTVEQLINLAKTVLKRLRLDQQSSEYFKEVHFKIIKFRNCVQFYQENDVNSIGDCKQLICHYSGKLYYGGWRKTNSNREGEKHGEGIEHVPNKCTYIGQFFKGLRHGTGKLESISNGNIYEGQWLEGKKHGTGKLYQQKTHSYYQGEWRDNICEGFGYLRTSQQEFYIGTFQNSIKSGQGTQFFSNGDRYRGQYKQGKFDGKGRYLWSNGSFYDGNFLLGQRQGFGYWRSSSLDGEMYIGQYKNDKKDGYGRYIQVDGSVFEGNFRQDHRYVILQKCIETELEGQGISMEGRSKGFGERESFFRKITKIAKKVIDFIGIIEKTDIQTKRDATVTKTAITRLLFSFFIIDNNFQQIGFIYFPFENYEQYINEFKQTL